MFGLFGRKAPAAERAYPDGQLAVTDPEVRKRLDFLQVTPKDLGVIQVWESTCKAACDPMIDEFYKHISKTRETQAIIEKHTSVERQRPLVTRYLLAMFTGTIDDKYVEYRRHVGMVHERIDLDSNWYVAMYEVIREHMLLAVERGGATPAEYRRFQRAFDRLLQADIAIVITALTNARQERVEQLLKGEAMRFLNEISDALSRLSQGDLTVRVVGQYSERNAEVQTNFNEAMEELSRTFGVVAQSSEEILETSAALRESSGVLADGASSQAASLEEVAASLQELTSMTQQSASHASEARAIAEQSKNTAADGVDSMKQLTDAIARIKAGADSTAKIIKTIDEIAFQTNLLALNAGVEAARAGDAGRGFAVVAQEVRGLAQRSAEAAKEIKGLIQTSSSQVDDGVKLIDETGKVADRIVRQVVEIDSLVAEMAASTKEQSTGLSEINTAISLMDQATQQNAAMVEQTTAAVHSLRTEAAELVRSIAGFSISATGPAGSAKAGKAPSRSAPPRNVSVSAVRGATALKVAAEADGWEEF
jgi:methyl-accepting chemotaxis protein